MSSDQQAVNETPLGPGIRRRGDDCTIVSFGRPLYFCLEAAETLAKEGIECEVIDGRTFRRYIARDAAAGTARVAVASAGADRRTVYFTSVLLALGLLMLLALGRSVRRRPAPVPLGWNGDLGPAPEELARRIAALDASFQRRRAPSVEERQEYERLRGGLKAQLTDAIARHGGSGVGA